ncbi:hypothetical protein Tco_0674265 [Tanacetum coccineum]
MSKSKNHVPTPDGSVVRNAAGKERAEEKNCFHPATESRGYVGADALDPEMERRRRESRSLIHMILSPLLQRKQEMIEERMKKTDRGRNHVELSSRDRIRMPGDVKTYDGTRDLEDHLKSF